MIMKREIIIKKILDMIMILIEMMNLKKILSVILKKGILIMITILKKVLKIILKREILILIMILSEVIAL
jgi:hypothetical protein